MINFKFKFKFPLTVKRDEKRGLTVIESMFFRIETDEFNFHLEQEEGE